MYINKKAAQNFRNDANKISQQCKETEERILFLIEKKKDENRINKLKENRELLQEHIYEEEVKKGSFFGKYKSV